MVATHPLRILGRWHEGFALDYHTTSSVYCGDDEYGHPIFDTKRSEIGELLFQLKYRLNQTVLPEIAEATAAFVTTWNPGAQVIIPVPASRPRPIQPVILLSQTLANRLSIPLELKAITKVKDVPELKNVNNYDQRIQLLEEVHGVNRAVTEGKIVLLFDDLYRSGATMNSIASLLYDEGGVKDVFALTITRTRSKM